MRISHQVGESHKRARERQAKVIGRLEIKHKFVTAWLFEAQFARLDPAKHARRVDGKTSIDPAPVNAIGHEASRLGQTTRWTHEGQPILACQLCNAIDVADLLGIRQNENCRCALGLCAIGAPVTAADRTQIDGEFNGCDYDQMYALTDGRILVCREYQYEYAYSPEVIVLDESTVLIAKEEYSAATVSCPCVPTSP